MHEIYNKYTHIYKLIMLDIVHTFVFIRAFLVHNVTTKNTSVSTRPESNVASCQFPTHLHCHASPLTQLRIAIDWSHIPTHIGCPRKPIITRMSRFASSRYHTIRCTSSRNSTQRKTLTSIPRRPNEDRRLSPKPTPQCTDNCRASIRWCGVDDTDLHFEVACCNMDSQLHRRNNCI